MTNHVHFVVVPEREDSMAMLFRRVHGRYAQYLNVRRERVGHLWQNRYRSGIVAPSHEWTVIGYVERNPVRALMVERAEAYRWSSARAHLTGVDEAGILDMEYWRSAGGRERWECLLADRDEVMEMRRLEAAVYAGRPYGGEEFVAGMEARFGRQWLGGKGLRGEDKARDRAVWCGAGEGGSG
jgi:putative transposase